MIEISVPGKLFIAGEYAVVNLDIQRSSLRWINSSM